MTRVDICKASPLIRKGSTECTRPDRKRVLADRKQVFRASYQHKPALHQVRDLIEQIAGFHMEGKPVLYREIPGMGQVGWIPHQWNAALVQVSGFTEKVAGIPQSPRRDVESQPPASTNVAVSCKSAVLPRVAQPILRTKKSRIAAARRTLAGSDEAVGWGPPHATAMASTL